MAHDDSPWRPDADVRFDHRPTRSFADPTPESASASSKSSFASRFQLPGARKPRRKRGFGVLGPAVGLVAVLAALVGGAVAVLGSDDAPRGEVAAIPAVEETPALPLTAAPCGVDRLPSTIQPSWDVEIAGVSRIDGPVLIGAGTVAIVASTDDPETPGGDRMELIALDAETGSEVWRTGLQSSSGRHELIAVTSEVVVVRGGAGSELPDGQLVGFDRATGVERWSSQFASDWFVIGVVDALVDDTLLVSAGTPTGTTPERTVEGVDSSVGRTIFTALGDGISFDGRDLVTRAGDKVLRVDATVSSPSDNELIGVIEPAGAPFTMMGTELVVGNSGLSAITVFPDGWSDDPERTADQRPIVGTDVDPPRTVVGLQTLSPDDLLLIGDGFVYGTAVDDFTAEVRWRADGVVLAGVPTDRGAILQMATEGGASQRLVDASTGRTVVPIEIRPGSLSTLSVHGNGVVLLDNVDGRSVRIAYDLDGEPLWELPGTGPLAVGDALLVDVDELAVDVVRLASYSGAVGTAGCSPAG